MDKKLWAPNVYSQGQWIGPSLITLNEDGVIISIQAKENVENHHVVPGPLIPGFQNCHSHIFQYAMTGLNENNSGGDDNFWSWRNNMYSIANKITPEHLKAIALGFFMEALEFGYTNHVEFHYLHNDKNGQRYDQESVLAEAIISAAEETGIELCLIPVFYNTGTIGSAILPEQKRFYSKSIHHFEKLLSDIQKLQGKYSFQLGHGVHSLRAAELNDCEHLLRNKISPGPIHIHIAEQVSEVEQFKAKYGVRPVEWLLNQNFEKPINLVHATHIDSKETEQLAKSHHNVVLCPTTEGNLGDGFFPLREFHLNGGNWCIGTDSHVSLSPMIEISLADYCQRNIHKIRNPLIGSEGGDSGQLIMDRIRSSSEIASGQRQDICVGEKLRAAILDINHPVLAFKPVNRWLSSLFYSNNSKLLKGVVIGNNIISNPHPKAETITKKYSLAIKDLLKSLN